MTELLLPFKRLISLQNLNMRLFIVVLVVFFMQSVVSASDRHTAVTKDTLTWIILNNVEYKEAPHETYGTVYLPEFSKEVKKMANKKVIIKGYLVPVDKTTWALSKNTYASCFFCGKAGPETVLGLVFKVEPGKLKMDANVYVTGTLIINGTNVDDWMYSLKDAEIIGLK